MKSKSLAFVLPILISLQLGCADNTSNPLKSQSSVQAVEDIENIVWRLSAFEKSGRNVDISSLPPFHLIFDETQFFGDDGCNWFGASYEAQDDRILPGNISQTLRLCVQATFPVAHLSEPFKLQIDEEELRIFVDDNTYTYRSDFTDRIHGSPLPGNWQLSSSTDPEFEDIQVQQLNPILSFDENRQFKITWDCSEDNSFGCDEIVGLFGTGSDRKILFYQRGGSYHGEGPGENFMQRILTSSSYRFRLDSPKGATLTLFNKDGKRFEFVALRRDGSSQDDTISFGDTLAIAHKDTLFNTAENIAITFDSLLSDSRCPVNVDCVWEGNAEIAFVFARDDQKAEFSLNTSGNFTSSVIRFNFQISLIDVLPVPHTDSTFVADDYIARIMINKVE